MLEEHKEFIIKARRARSRRDVQNENANDDTPVAAPPAKRRRLTRRSVVEDTDNDASSEDYLE